jgi:hypothetical protein
MPRAGQHYPGTYAAMRAWFPDDAALSGLLGLAALACGFQMPVLWLYNVLGAEPWRVALY